MLVLAALESYAGLAVESLSKGASRVPGHNRHVKMQTLAPDRTIAKPPATLPDSWVVPDTFSLASLKRTVEPEAPMYRLTLLKSTSADETGVVNALLDVVPGMALVRAKQIAKQLTALGVAFVGVWEQELAETYAAGLRTYRLVCDVSPEG